jgi:Family of unknown function (DUF6932)
VGVQYGDLPLAVRNVVSLPAFTEAGDLPPGIHRATLHEVLIRFGTDTPRRRIVGARLERIFRTATATGQVARFIVFGSFVTAKPEPNDVDVFLLIEDAFDAGLLTGEARLLFDHATAQAHFGASVFWLRRLAALAGEEETVEYWGTKRDGGVRGLVEIIPESS